MLGSGGFIVIATVYAFISAVHAFFLINSTLGENGWGRTKLVVKNKISHIYFVFPYIRISSEILKCRILLFSYLQNAFITIKSQIFYGTICLLGGKITIIWIVRNKSFMKKKFSRNQWQGVIEKLLWHTALTQYIPTQMLTYCRVAYCWKFFQGMSRINSKLTLSGLCELRKIQGR